MRAFVRVSMVGTLAVWAALPLAAQAPPPATPAAPAAAGLDPNLPTVMVLDPAKDKNVWIKGTPVVSRYGPWVINSHSNKALDNWGAQIRCENGLIGVCGSAADGFEGMTDPLPVRIKPMGDPLADRKWPAPAQIASRQATRVDSRTPIRGRPGVYIGGITVAGNTTAVLDAGVYYCQDGDFSVEGTVVGQGVTIVLGGDQPGRLNVGAWGSIAIAAPKEGDFAGVCVVSLGEKETTLWGTGRLGGLVYVPRSKVSFWVSKPYAIERLFCWQLGTAGEGTIEFLGVKPPEPLPPAAEAPK
ncbi:MAG: hypothetical protein HZB16_13535 [Armatimonadetes bacterium]|nr:hypothetical protein [Armatimonadota bacterium]